MECTTLDHQQYTNKNELVPEPGKAQILRELWATNKTIARLLLGPWINLTEVIVTNGNLQRNDRYFL